MILTFFRQKDTTLEFTVGSEVDVTLSVMFNVIPNVSPMFPQNVMFNVILCVIMIQSHKYQATLLNGSPKPPFNILNITIETTPLLLL